MDARRIRPDNLEIYGGGLRFLAVDVFQLICDDDDVSVCPGQTNSLKRELG